MRVIYTSVSRWFPTRVTASRFKSPGLFSVFRPILTMLQLGWSPLVFLFPSLPVPGDCNERTNYDEYDRYFYGLYFFQIFNKVEALKREYYYYPFSFFHISFSWWSFTGVWVTASLLKSPKTLLSILVVLNSAVVWMVSTRTPISKSSSPFSKPLVTVPKPLVTVPYNWHHHVPYFLNFLARSRYLSFFSNSFSFILWSAGRAKSTIFAKSFFSVDYYKVWSSSRD